MVSEREQLKNELEKARTALDFKENSQSQPNEMYELQAQMKVQEDSYLLYLSQEELVKRIERLERDLQDLNRGRFQKNDS